MISIICIVVVIVIVVIVIIIIIIIYRRQDFSSFLADQQRLIFAGKKLKELFCR